MPVGPVELLVLSFPNEDADPAVIAAVQDVVASGFITLLDLVFLSRSRDGEITEIDVSESLDDVGLGLLELQEQALISEDDLELARDTLDPGHSAAVIVYENSWARTVSGAIADAGGELTLHVRIPRDVVEAALEAGDMDGPARLGSAVASCAPRVSWPARRCGSTRALSPPAMR